MCAGLNFSEALDDQGRILFYDGLQKEPSDIEIAAGTYSVDASLILNQRIIIPEKQKCVKKGITGRRECYTIPKVDFGEKSAPGQERFPEGGLKLNFTLNPSDLASSDTIVLYAVSIDLAGVPEQQRVVEDIEQISKFEDYSKIYQLALQPTFVK